MHKFCILFHVNSGESCEYPQNPPHGKWDCFTHGKPVNRRGLITAAADGEYEPYQGNHDSHFIALQKKCHNKSVQGRAGLTESCLEHVNLRCHNMVSSICVNFTCDLFWTKTYSGVNWNILCSWKNFSGFQCRLECDSGFIAQRTPVINCVDGVYAQGVIIGSISDTFLVGFVQI